MNDPIVKLFGDWAADLELPGILLRIALSVILSAVIGCERAGKRHAAGLRTFMLVSLSATLAILIDVGMLTGASFPILSAATVIGVSIIGVNSTVYSSRSQIKGLTTAFALFTSCILGILVGTGLYTATLIVFVLLLVLLSAFPRFERLLKNRSNHFEIHLELKNSHFLQDFVTTIRELGLRIDDIELNPAYQNSGLSVYSVAISIYSEELRRYKTHSEIIEALRSLEYISHIEEMN